MAALSRKNHDKAVLTHRRLLSAVGNPPVPGDPFEPGALARAVRALLLAQELLKAYPPEAVAEMIEDLS